MSIENSTENGSEGSSADGRKITSGASLVQKSSVVGGMPLISRILGLLRDVIFARFFGASLVMDAFLIANRIPNMLRRFFAEVAE